MYALSIRDTQFLPTKSHTCCEGADFDTYLNNMRAV